MPNVDFPSYVKDIISTEVITQIFNHIDTPAWQLEVSSKIENETFTDNAKIRHRGTIINYGQSDFTKEFEGITTDDKVLLYAFYYFQLHYSSSYAVYEWALPVLEKFVWKACSGAIFIDIGCGPFTSGMAFLEFCNQHFSAYKRFTLDYVGIDIAPSMIEKAKAIESNYKANYSAGRLKFRNVSFDNSYKYLLELNINPGVGIFINCCYLFASSSLDINDFIEAIKEFRARHPEHLIFLFYQNATTGNVESKYNDFVKKVGFLYGSSLKILDKSVRFKDEFNSYKSSYSEPTANFRFQLLQTFEPSRK